MKTLIANTCFLCLLLPTLFTQNIQLGGQLGIGKSAIERYSNTLVSPLDNDAYNYVKLGVNLYRSLAKSPLILRSGLSYNYRGNKDFALNAFRIPLALELRKGKKMQGILGGGIFGSYIAVARGIDFDLRSEEIKGNFQIGILGYVGVGYKINDQVSVSLLYEADLDRTLIQDREVLSPGGFAYDPDLRGNDGSINMLVKFGISNIY